MVNYCGLPLIGGICLLEHPGKEMQFLLQMAVNGSVWLAGIAKMRSGGWRNYQNKMACPKSLNFLNQTGKATRRSYFKARNTATTPVSTPRQSIKREARYQFRNFLMTSFCDVFFAKLMAWLSFPKLILPEP